MTFAADIDKLLPNFSVSSASETLSLHFLFNLKSAVFPFPSWSL